jgi:hypothetical protein
MSIKMKKIFLLLILVSVCNIIYSQGSGPLKVLPENPRYFTNGSGKAVYLTGSHTWNNFATDQGSSFPPIRFDYNKFLDFLQKHNHNFFRGWVWELTISMEGSNGGPFYWDPMPWQRTGPGSATDGKPKFDLTMFNKPFFDRLRERVIAAGNRGIYVSIMLFQGYVIQFGRTDKDGYPLDGRNNINGIDAGPGNLSNTLRIPEVTAKQEEYVARIIDAVNDLDNVLYEISNESGSYATEWQYHMIDFIHKYEASKPKQHPVGMTFQFRGGKNEELFASNADWISPSCSHGYIMDPLISDGKKVIIPDTDHDYGWQGLRKDGPAAQQAWVWKNFLRGNQTLFMDPYLAKIKVRNNPVGNSTDPYFGIEPDPYWDTIRNAMGRARSYAQRLDLAATTPDKSISSTGYCLVNPGKEYLIYKTDTVNLFTVELIKGRYNYEWYIPSTGTVAEKGKTKVQSGMKKFKAPFSGDAVLYLKSDR